MFGGLGCLGALGFEGLEAQSFTQDSLLSKEPWPKSFEPSGIVVLRHTVADLRGSRNSWRGRIFSNLLTQSLSQAVAHTINKSCPV